MSSELQIELLWATGQTIYMVMASGLIATFFGLPIGVFLLATQRNGLLENRIFNLTMGAVVNAGRSIPFIILLVAIIPLTRWLVGTSIGTTAAIVPLTIGAIPFVARIVENALSEVNPGLVEAGTSMGASPFQIILKILIPESLPAVINGLTVVMVSLIGYSAMAGTIGGGGLGDLAIRYGYQRFNIPVMLITVILLIVLVQVIQYIGDALCNNLTHHKYKRGK